MEEYIGMCLHEDIDDNIIELLLNSNITSKDVGGRTRIFRASEKLLEEMRRLLDSNNII